jgi:hypothetical protein
MRMFISYVECLHLTIQNILRSKQAREAPAESGALRTGDDWSRYGKGSRVGIHSGNSLSVIGQTLIHPHIQFPTPAVFGAQYGVLPTSKYVNGITNTRRLLTLRNKLST